MKTTKKEILSLLKSGKIKMTSNYKDGRSIIKEIQDERNAKKLKQKSASHTLNLKYEFFKNNGFLLQNTFIN